MVVCHWVQKMYSVCVWVHQYTQACVCVRVAQLEEENINRAVITGGKQDKITFAVFCQRNAKTLFLIYFDYVQMPVYLYKEGYSSFYVSLHLAL